MATNRWIASSTRATKPQLRVYCFSHAGRGASMYAQWRTALGPNVEVCPVQLPGREERFAEPPARRMRMLVDGFLEAVGRELASAPFALFGHSMGAALAYEVARQLREDPARQPRLLIVSGAQSPHANARRKRLHDLPEPRLLDELRRWNGTPERVLRDPELLEIVLPIIRADLEVLETYNVADDYLLRCDVLALAGTHDPSVSPIAMSHWRDYTRGAFDLHVVAGDHFFVNTNARAVQAIVAAALEKVSDRGEVEEQVGPPSVMARVSRANR